MILLIDNYDSFTFNLVHCLGELGAECEVYRNDALGVGQALSAEPEAVVISPGPCDPDRAGISVELVRQADPALPILGVCLGHQAVAAAFGGIIEQNHEIMHGKRSSIQHRGGGLFAGLPKPFEATRYHSLAVRRDSMPDCLEITAETEDGTVMGISHRERPVHGVQFHPESIATEHGHQLLGNFLRLLEARA